MTTISSGCRLSLVLTLAGSAACASNRVAEGPCGPMAPSTAGWSAHDEGAFTVQLPPAYERVTIQGIDSQVGRWEAPGKRVSYDLGAYSNPLQPNDLNAFPEMVVCQEGDGRGEHPAAHGPQLRPHPLPPRARHAPQPIDGT